MLELTVDAIRDYEACGLYHKYRYIDGYPVVLSEPDKFGLRYEEIMRKVLAFYFYKQQAGAAPSFNALINRWERLWFPKEMTAYDISVKRTPQAKTFVYQDHVSYSNQASGALLKFYEQFSQHIGDPIQIEDKYFVPLSKEVKLHGRFDLVLRFKDDIRIYKWLLKGRRPSQAVSTMDFAALMYAFHYRNSKSTLKPKYFLYDLASGIEKPLTQMHPTEHDVESLLYWARQIHQGTYVPRRGFSTYCRGCQFDSPCQEFQDWPNNAESS